MSGNGQQLFRFRDAEEEFVVNLLLGRRAFVEQFLDSRRSIDDECGYPKSVTVQELRDLYDRDPIAARVVEIFPKESWQVTPRVYETEDLDSKTEFEKAWEELCRSLRSEQSWFSGEQNVIWDILLRADILSGIGHYGIILIGLDDGKPLREPVEKGDHKVIYLQPYDETNAAISAFETDESSPRFGRPLMYDVVIGDPRDAAEKSGSASVGSRTVKVHWTRVVHIVDDRTSSEVYGVPRMLPVLNRLMDLRKLYGGSAEMYWRGAFPGFSIETHPKLGGKIKFNTSAIKDQLENYMNGLQRYLALAGVTIKSLSPQVVDPRSQIEAHVEAICIRLGVPKRIFLGSERGELASSQDERAWLNRIRHRQEFHITPRIIVPLVDRLIQIGALPEPREGYTIYWPEVVSLRPEEKAKLAQVRTEALSKYIQGGVNQIMTPLDYLTRELGYDEEEAEAILDAVAEEEAEEEAQKELEKTKAEAEEKVVEQPAGAETVPEEALPEQTGEEAEELTGLSLNELDELLEALDLLENVFCPTGPGGGIDPTCKLKDLDRAISRVKSAADKVKRVLGDKTPPKVRKAVGTLLKLSNAMPEFARMVAEEAGAPPKVARLAYIAATLGDFAVPGAPVGSAAVVLAASFKRPTASIAAAKRLYREWVKGAQE